MVRASRCHRLNMKTYIINGSEVSRLSVAIHKVPKVSLKEYSILKLLYPGANTLILQLNG